MTRATPTLADCTSCGKPMAAVRGPFSPTIGRAKPPMGRRLGYVGFVNGEDRPICAACLANALPSNLATYRRIA